MKQIGYCRRPTGYCSAVFEAADGRRHVGELLNRPERPFYPTMRRDLRRTALVENWIDAALHARSWPDRTVAFDLLIRELLASGNTPIDCVKAAGVLTAIAGEHLCEKQFTEADAAHFYQLTLHHQWRAAGEHFLKYQSAARNRRWLALHPGFDQMISMVNA